MRMAPIFILPAGLFCLISCSGDNNPIQTNRPLFSVVVRDATGDPVAGLRVGSINHPIGAKAAPYVSGKPCPETQISFSLPEECDWELTVENYNGRKIRSFSGHADAGLFTQTWDGLDSTGMGVPSGFYHYELTAGSYSDAKWSVFEKGPDPCETIIGALDGNGRFFTDDTALFPGLLSQQPIEFYTDTVTIHLSRPDYPDDFFLFTTRLELDGNTFLFIYDSLGLPNRK